MATKRAENYALDTNTANNSFSAWWKWTRCAKAAGATYKASGNGSTKDTSGTASSDLWGGNADPMVDTYPTAQLDTRAAWWCGEWPSTVKIGITAASIGTLKRGEIVTQSVSGATGELRGYVINAAGSSGWVVIAPQTGTFDGTHTVTGGTSGATVLATSYNLFRRQVVIAKNTTVTSGWIFYECISDTEVAASSNTGLFSDLAANAANCTATVCPGNSSSGSNRFPVYAYTVIGTSESTGAVLFGDANSFGKAQIVCVNATASAGVSADATCWAAIWQTSGYYNMLGLHIMDDTEPGDVEYYTWQAATTESILTAAGRTAATPVSGAKSWTNLFSGSGVTAKGYCARGTGTMGTGTDAYAGASFAVATAVNSSTPVGVINGASMMRTRNHPDSVAGSATVAPFEPLTVITQQTGLTMRKGVCRWLGTFPDGALVSTWDAKQWLVILAQTTTVNPAVVVGPLDGATTPSGT